MNAHLHLNIKKEYIMKIGREVEGRFRGLLTLFLDAHEALDFFERPSLKAACKNQEAKDLIEKVRHIYITDHTHYLTPNSYCLKMWGELGFVVCIERRRVTDRDMWPSHVSFLLAVEHPDVSELFGTDQIKFIIPDRLSASFVPKVMSVRVGQMDKTFASEFLQDVEVIL
jgi:hypothetical protein